MLHDSKEEEDFLGAPELSARFVLSPTPEPKPADGDTLADNPHGSLSAFEAASSAPAIGDSYLHHMFASPNLLSSCRPVS